MNINKYIKEKGIIQLIHSYMKYRMEQIYKTIYDLSNNLYGDENGIIKLVNPFNGPNFNICIITNNYFVSISNVLNSNWECEEHKIKFKKNERCVYIKILKDSINLSAYKFRCKYKKILGPRILYNMNNLCALLQNYNTELYNIQFRIYAEHIERSWHMEYFCNVFVMEDSMCNIKDIFLEKIKENIIIFYYHMFRAHFAFINISNIKN
jgi:hypothetical protein